MASVILVIVLVVSILLFALLVFIGLKYRKRYLLFVKKKYRKEWKAAHQKSLRGNFVLTYDSPIEEKYSVDKRKKLGQGSFGVVVLGTHRETGNQYAIKFINKSHEERKRLERELRILKDVDHPNIVGLFAVYDTDEQVVQCLPLVSVRFVSVHSCNTLLISYAVCIHTGGLCHGAVYGGASGEVLGAAARQPSQRETRSDHYQTTSLSHYTYAQPGHLSSRHQATEYTYGKQFT